MSKLTEVQTVLGVVPDGKWGPKSQAALDAAINEGHAGQVHSVQASSFADPADVAAFRKCKAAGNSDQFCFSKGDNGIGRWGDDTTTAVPMCALPPEDWEFLGSRARGAKVLVKSGGKEVVCELRDTMPHRKNITNGAGIDLNAAAWKVLGKTPPVMESATWQWV